MLVNATIYNYIIEFSIEYIFRVEEKELIQIFSKRFNAYNDAAIFFMESKVYIKANENKALNNESRKIEIYTTRSFYL